MTRIHKAILVLALTVVGVWGCAKPGSPAVASADKFKQLEARVVKLESDVLGAYAARDDFAKKLTQAQSASAALQVKLTAAEELAKKQMVQIAGVELERDGLQAKLKAKSTEREQVQAQFDSFRKTLKELVGAAEATPTATGF